MDDDQSRVTERLLRESLPKPEAPAGETIFNGLKDRCLGPHLAEFSLASFAVEQRLKIQPQVDALRQLDIQSAQDGVERKDESAELKAQIRDSIKSSEVYRQRTDIIEATLDANELKAVAIVNEYLKEHSALTEQIVSSLVSIQHERLAEMKTVATTAGPAMDHVTRVVNLVRMAPDTEPLMMIAAAVHDADKYAGNTFLLAEHEHLSAIMGTKLAGEALELAGLGAARTALEKIIGKAIVAHGEGEWPELQSRQDRFGRVLDDPDDEVSLLFGAPFIKSKRSDEIPIAAASAGTDQGMSVELCRKIIRGVSEADKIDGMSIDSFLKYSNEAKPLAMFMYPTSYDQMLTYGDTFILNYEYAPDAVGIKSGPRTEKLILQGGLFFGFLKDIAACQIPEDPMQVDDADIAAALPTYTKHLGAEKTGDLYRLGMSMQKRFAEGRRYAQQKDEPAAKRVQTEYNTYLERLLEEIKMIDVATADQEVRDAAVAMRQQLKQAYTAYT